MLPSHLCDPQAPKSASKWKEAKDATGQIYYFHSETKAVRQKHNDMLIYLNKTIAPHWLISLLLMLQVSWDKPADFDNNEVCRARLVAHGQDGDRISNMLCKDTRAEAAFLQCSTHP